MKIVFVLLFLTSCVTTPVKKQSPALTPVDKVFQCVLKLIGELNVEAEKAQRVCKNIFEAK